MTSTTARTRFSQYKIVSAREPATFWRKNVMAVVIPLRVFGENVVVEETTKLANVRSFIILWLREGLTSIEQ